VRVRRARYATKQNGDATECGLTGFAREPRTEQHASQRGAGGTHAVREVFRRHGARRSRRPRGRAVRARRTSEARLRARGVTQACDAPRRRSGDGRRATRARRREAHGQPHKRCRSAA
jgi:hypothetical protein